MTEFPPELLEIEAADRNLGIYRKEAIKAAGYRWYRSRRVDFVDPERSGLMTFWRHPEKSCMLIFLKQGDNYTYSGISRSKR